MNQSEVDLDYLLENETSLRTGVYGLWLRVLLNSFISLKNGDEYSQGARSFLFDENPFFDLVADQLEYSPEGLRERIRKALEKHQDKQ